MKTPVRRLVPREQSPGSRLGRGLDPAIRWRWRTPWKEDIKDGPNVRIGVSLTTDNPRREGGGGIKTQRASALVIYRRLARLEDSKKRGAPILLFRRSAGRRSRRRRRPGKKEKEEEKKEVYFLSRPFVCPPVLRRAAPLPGPASASVWRPSFTVTPATHTPTPRHRCPAPPSTPQAQHSPRRSPKRRDFGIQSAARLSGLSGLIVEGSGGHSWSS